MMIIPMEMGAFFPVVFYDGEQQLDIGTILITPTMNFKSFQSEISHKIGISPNQITTYFTPTPHFPDDDLHRRPRRLRCRRRPVTNKFNFSLAMMDSAASFFHVVLKRSRRLRRQPRQIPHSSDYNYDLVPLRRYPSPDTVDSLSLNSDGYNYLSSWYNAGNHYNGGNDDVDVDWGSFTGGVDGGSSSGCGSSSVAFCDVCFNHDDDDTVPFHCCKNDAAGPIAPPSKSKTVRFTDLDF